MDPYLDWKRLDVERLPRQTREIYDLIKEEAGEEMARRVICRMVYRFGGGQYRLASPESVRRAQDERIVHERLAEGCGLDEARRGTIFSLRQVRRMVKAD